MTTGPGPIGGARRQLAGGTLVVAIGLGLTGLGTVLTMALSARALSPSEYAAFAVWWTVATLLGTTFGVFEAYLARLVVTDRAAHRSPAPVIGLLAGRAAVVVAILAVALVAGSPLIAQRLFADHLDATLVLPIFTAIAAA